ncbi:ABC transporter permease [Pseudomarimonas salicorniae]|uniref:ABC transporter permease n=1 Tax=Pseudomarimonas salicorniae TaxID=2933270 RepID=A0ABT0GCX5_9GAMM|nr:ABC transporter permease [Lysobacter sp. CAU 1642]MCK7592381.1 ABC transporter permease [Lysobacter sp. CAU 1642]
MIAALPRDWREAFEELSRRKLRTGLTLLGLVFGVGAIVAMLAVGEGSKREALRLVEGLGLNNLIAQSQPADQDALRERRQRSLGLSMADARAALAVVPEATAVAAEKDLRVHEVLAGSRRSDAKASAVTPDYFALSALRVAEGRLFEAADEAGLAAVAVLGHQAAASLFPDGSAVGQSIKLNHAWLQVIGVLEDRDFSKADFEGVQLGLESNRIFVPLRSARARLRFQPLDDEIDRLLLRVAGPEHIAPGAKVLGALLDQRHAGVEDYQLIVPAQLFQQHQQTQRIFRIVMAAIAAVSLLVGGIGIMNIMLANVLERRREIGLLRALGARQRDIVAQFLREAAVICVLGAVAGVLFGGLLAYLIAWGAGWQVAWAPLPVLAAAVSCTAVGLAFGVYPARQAARLDPITALRSE